MQISVRRTVLPLLLLAVLSASAQAGPADAVVRLPSHGGSGTVIATGDGWTLILSCAHCFEGRGRTKPPAVDMPHPQPGPPQKVGTQVLAVGRADDVDLSLIRLNTGPVQYVAPVAPLSVRGPDCWSVGFDGMRFPPTVKPARIVGAFNQNSTITDNRPWHGRSGGALIEKRTGYLVGVCSAYTGPSNHADFMPGHHGVYVSLPAIHRFLQKAGAMQGAIDSAPGPPDCPGGVCPVPGFGPQQFGPGRL